MTIETADRSADTLVERIKHGPAFTFAAELAESVFDDIDWAFDARSPDHHVVRGGEAHVGYGAAALALG